MRARGLLLLLACLLLPEGASAQLRVQRDPRGRLMVSNVPAGSYSPGPRSDPRPQGKGAASRAAGPEKLSALIREVARRNRIATELVRAVVSAESAFDPRAVSPKGARGLMQLMPGTARDLGVQDVHDPRLNLEAGTRHLSRLIDLYAGDLRLALAAYNAGEDAVRRYGGVPPYPETRDYVERVLRSFAALSRGDLGPGGSGLYRYRDAGGSLAVSNLAAEIPGRALELAAVR